MPKWLSLPSWKMHSTRLAARLKRKLQLAPKIERPFESPFQTPVRANRIKLKCHFAGISCSDLIWVGSVRKIPANENSRRENFLTWAAPSTAAALGNAPPLPPPLLSPPPAFVLVIKSSEFLFLSLRRESLDCIVCVGGSLHALL